MNGSTAVRLLVVVSMAAFVAGCSVGGGGGGGDRGGLIDLSACPAGLDTATLANEAIQRTNNERAQAGLAPLTFNSALAAAALAHAQDLGIRGFGDDPTQDPHVNPEGQDVGDRITAQGYVWTGAAENIEFGGCSAQQAVDDWMNSSGHRKNILNPSLNDPGQTSVYTEIGIGVYQGGEEGPYWVQVFGEPA